MCSSIRQAGRQRTRAVVQVLLLEEHLLGELMTWIPPAGAAGYKWIARFCFHLDSFGISYRPLVAFVVCSNMSTMASMLLYSVDPLMVVWS